ncbi:phosphoribosylanthranilate isomerase [Alkalibacillus salilacus]|uniref:N-(5'-phosphoribosyl)anthranilate isomerase n=1 Tax=Alkalibacillus salilacus TaxID=284582 RepID=A0ABT9VED2_9BACI|nr:phosphoribosylanthranilate isomerase [Alkalibacillus salilacus]MDQ0159303.1 phosphoribosylanthranilate isomerase [Alkalibacillus salilacus]
MKVQIYEIRSIKDAQKAVEAGADHLGIPYDQDPTYPGHLTCEEAMDVFESIPSNIVKIGLTISEDIHHIRQNLKTVMPNVLHLSGNIEAILPEEIERLKQDFKPLKIMQAIPVYADQDLASQKALDYVRRYEHVSDYFLIDTKSHSEDVIGATGTIHDWQIDRAIIESTDVPCIIAGGLSSENVQEAIRISRPYGVDSFTSTNEDNPIDEKHIKSIEKIRAFVEAAHNA